MDNTINASAFEKIFESKYGWIGKLGGSQYESFYLIVQNQRAVSGTIAVEITKRDAENIIASGGDAQLIDSAARNLENGYLFVQ